MNGVTHLAGGVLAGCVVIAYTSAAEPWPALLAVAGIGALVPDVDNQRATIQRLVPRRGKPLVRLLGYLPHRGVTHSLVFVILSALIMTGFSLPGTYILAFTAGIVSHLLLDTLNPMGVPWLWPLFGRWSFPLVNSSSFMEKFLVTPVMVFLAFYGAYSLWR